MRETTVSGEGSEPAEVRLSAESIEALTVSIAEAIGGIRSPEQPDLPPRLLTAAEVARWWGVDRSWVYNHAAELGARRLGSGRRPRLRFDPDEVAERLGAPLPQRRDSRGFPPIRGDSHPDSLSARSRATVVQSRNQVAGRRSNAPGPAPKAVLRRDQKPSPAGRSRRRFLRRREELSGGGE
ncbi:MAG: helix-turn-helix domain-containing protein [Chloroflexota bacterium]